MRQKPFGKKRKRSAAKTSLSSTLEQQHSRKEALLTCTKSLKVTLEDVSACIGLCELCGKNLWLPRLSEHYKREHDKENNLNPHIVSIDDSSPVSPNKLQTSFYEPTSNVIVETKSPRPYRTRPCILTEEENEKIKVEIKSTEAESRSHHSQSKINTIKKSKHKGRGKSKKKHKKSEKHIRISRTYYLCCFCRKTFNKRTNHLVHLMHKHVNTSVQKPLKVPFQNVQDMFKCKVKVHQQKLSKRSARKHKTKLKVQPLSSSIIATATTAAVPEVFQTFSPMPTLSKSLLPASCIHDAIKRNPPIILLVDIAQRIKVPCSLCDLELPVSQMTEHIQTNHVKKEQLDIDCQTCGYLTPSAFELQKHDNEHNILDPLTCKICAKRFQTTKHLLSHGFSHAAPSTRSRTQRKSKPFVCSC